MNFAAVTGCRSSGVWTHQARGRIQQQGNWTELTQTPRKLEGVESFRDDTSTTPTSRSGHD
ncbi:hypothetical protein DJICPGNB_07915 [Escherichia coli]|nr:hypothetical protein DJICPGNB_07915 [Escherichia coli]